MSVEKALARQLHEASTVAETQAAQKRLEAHVKQRVKAGMKEKQVRAAIKAWLTRLKKWEDDDDN
jgi:hypothetical protein